MTTRSDSPIRRTFSRRTFAGGAAAALAAPAILRSPRSAAAATNLDFVIWNYAEDIVQDNINIFQESEPGHHGQAELIRLASLPRDDGQPLHLQDRRPMSPTTAATGSKSSPPRAGSSARGPLRLGAGYKDKVLPFAWQDMTYNGKVYGLPYYADTITFMYNKKILEDTGITAPPQTWDEVTGSRPSSSKRAAWSYPFVYEFANTLPNVSEAFASMVFGRGGELIERRTNPLWTDPESPAAKQLQWLVDAKNEHDILDIMAHETTITKAMNTGQHAFTVLFNYNLAALNNAPPRRWPVSSRSP